MKIKTENLPYIVGLLCILVLAAMLYPVGGFYVIIHLLVSGILYVILAIVCVWFICHIMNNF